MSHNLFIHFHIGEQLRQFGANMNKAIVNIIIQVLFVNLLFCLLGKYLSGSGVAESQNLYMISFM